jgi:hypothetical protein
MKHTLALVLMVFGSFGAFADSISIKGEMQCKVKDQIILKTEDGISTRYQGFAEDIKIGDTLILSYRFTNQPSVATASGLSIMNFNLNKETVSNSIIYGTFYEDEFLKIEDNVLGFRQRHLDDMRIDPSERITFSADMMHIQDVGGVNKLKLRRYYKNDWEGFFTINTMDKFSNHAATLNCRQETDVIEEIINKINELHFSKVVDE